MLKIRQNHYWRIEHIDPSFEVAIKGFLNINDNINITINENIYILRKIKWHRSLYR